MTTHNVYTLTTANTAYQIIAADGGNGDDVTIQNNNATGDLLIGAAGITTSSYGFKLVPNAAISFELDGKDSIWAVSSTAGVAANIMSVKLEATRIV